ncbi:hypothetical protein KC660_04600, partial [Candidatus Dojkabacteria bacterium]|nr:hypothetical protein [Candidatus Dojkabacteria bacterium]
MVKAQSNYNQNLNPVQQAPESTRTSSTGFQLSSFIFFLAAILLVVGAGAAVYLYLKKTKKDKAIEKSLDTVLLEVRVPKENEVEIKSVEQMFSGFHDLKTVKGI